MLASFIDICEPKIKNMDLSCGKQHETEVLQIINFNFLFELFNKTEKDASKRLFRH